MPREWKEYMKDEERRAHGQWMAEAMQAILDSVGAPTLAQLQRFEYKHTDAGISVSFELDDGSHVWPGDPQATDPSLCSRVSKVGLSSIVEGSDAEVPLVWLDLADERFETPQEVVSAYERLAAETNDLACSLWDQEHGEP